ncbi:MAG: hypothetical protein M0C28_15955 [Candidatus Moduliflexus flocculans]|nr:hypothetical protein [Candidatus Moduliflexus flocculans]
MVVHQEDFGGFLAFSLALRFVHLLHVGVEDWNGRRKSTRQPPDVKCRNLKDAADHARPITHDAASHAIKDLIRWEG